MTCLKTLLIVFVAASISLLASHVQAQGRPTATLNIVNNTNATLQIDVQSRRHFDEHADVTISPITERRISVPAGSVILRVRAIKGNPVEEFSRNLILNNGSQRELNIFAEDFGRWTISDASPGNTGSGSPATRKFDSPMFKGYRLDWCRSWATNCGKGAADAFCQYEGFPGSVSHTFAANIPPTKIISSEKICDNPDCGGFGSVTCGG